MLTLCQSWESQEIDWTFEKNEVIRFSQFERRRPMEQVDVDDDASGPIRSEVQFWGWMEGRNERWRDEWRREDEEGIGIQRLGSKGWGREEKTGVLRGRKKTWEARKAEVYIENKPENFTWAWMTEWSKVLRSGRSVETRAGSNPASSIFLFFFVRFLFFIELNNTKTKESCSQSQWWTDD